MPEDDDRTVPTEHGLSASEHIDAILDATACLEDPEHKYPMRREELASQYADQEIDLPNETESLGSVFDRLTDRRYESAIEAREAVLNELTGEEHDLQEYNDERPLEPLAEDTSVVGTLEDSREEE